MQLTIQECFLQESVINVSSEISVFAEGKNI